MTRGLEDVAVGDRVQVFDVNGRRAGQPPGGWDGTVVRKGHKLIDVEFGHTTQTYRIDTGQWNNRDFATHSWIRTPEEAQRNQRRGEALTRIRELGFNDTGRVSHSLETLEAVVKTLEAYT